MQSVVLLLLVLSLCVSALNMEQLHDIKITGSQIGGDVYVDGNHGQVTIEANNSIHECDGTVREINDSELERLRKHHIQLSRQENSKNHFRNKSKGRQVAGVKANKPTQSRRRPAHGRVANVSANKKHNPFNRNNRRGRKSRNRRNKKRGGRRHRHRGQVNQHKPDVHWPASVSPCNTCNNPKPHGHGNETESTTANYEGGYTSDSYQVNQDSTHSYDSSTGYYEATTGSSSI
ncbi:hypothetical protein M3Y98_00017400 [Aphelenchoides besseyi]|nr:hypothetical protein M3Y98_00017400 [Aphelenchoides besseyi]KAI6199218.1 hypothetical protein M3Y96_00603100 [Aphelenchoides besseyi]